MSNISLLETSFLTQLSPGIICISVCYAILRVFKPKTFSELRELSFSGNIHVKKYIKANEPNFLGLSNMENNTILCGSRFLMADDSYTPRITEL